jgi:outer membrane biosynthesis protein TonB
VAQLAPPPEVIAALPTARAAPAAPVALETSGRPATTSAVDPAAIQAVVRSRLSEIERCYARGKMDDPELKGRVTVRLHIGPRGVVVADELESSSLANSGVESCILEVVRDWRFPSPAGGRTAVISYPFNLR